MINIIPTTVESKIEDDINEYEDMMNSYVINKPCEIEINIMIVVKIA